MNKITILTLMWFIVTLILFPFTSDIRFAILSIIFIILFMIQKLLEILEN